MVVLSLPSSSHLVLHHHRSRVLFPPPSSLLSGAGAQHMEISGMMDPSKAKSKCILYRDLIEEDHEQDVREIQRLRFHLFNGNIIYPQQIIILRSLGVIISRTRQLSLSSTGKTTSSVGDVQNHSISVDKHMIKHQIPRLLYISKLNNNGANPWEVLNQARSKFQHHSAAIQVPIGLEDDFKGLVDLVQLKAYSFHSSKGGKVVVEEVPANLEALVLEKRHELINTVSEVDGKLAEALCCDKPISASDLEEAVRRATIARKFIPVFMGSAFKYKNL